MDTEVTGFLSRNKFRVSAAMTNMVLKQAATKKIGQGD